MMYLKKIKNTSFEKHRRDAMKSMFCPVFMHLSALRGCGAASLAAVSVLMERGGLQDPVCQQPACERHCLAEVHHWQMSKTPLYSPSPFLVYLPLLSLSTENTEAL